MEPIADLDEVKELLSACELPTSDVTPSRPLLFFGRRAADRLVGVVGLEVYGAVALLRSVAVAPEHRKQGLGSALVAFAEGHAASLGVRTLYLFTDTAEAFFSGLGYTRAAREEAPAPIKATPQFAELCPSSSVLMTKHPVRPQ